MVSSLRSDHVLPCSDARLVGSAWQECSTEQLHAHQLLFWSFLMQVCNQCGTMLVSNFSYLLEVIRNMKYLENKMSTGCSQAAFNRQWKGLGEPCRHLGNNRVVPGEAIGCYDHKRDTDKLLLMVSG